MDTFTSARLASHVVRTLTSAYSTQRTTTLRIVAEGRERTTSILVDEKRVLSEGIRFKIYDMGTDKYYTTTIVQSQLDSPVTFTRVN